jgi:hypothetical protein
MAAIHMATMAAARRLRTAEILDHQNSAANVLNKCARTYTAQVAALKAYRSNGEQHIKVHHQHIAVGDGGQAIIGGNLQAGGVGSHKKNAD